MNGTTNILSDAIRRPPSWTQTRPATSESSYFSWPRLIEVSLDVITVFVCLEVGFHLAILKTFRIPLSDTNHTQIVSFIFSCVMVMLLDRAGAYRMSGGLLRIRETASVFESVFIATVVIVPSMLLMESSGWIFLALLEAPVVALALVLQKHLFHVLLAKLYQKGFSRHRVLIYGAGASARVLGAALARSPKLGFHPVALVSDVRNAESDILSRNTGEHGGAITLLHVDFSASLIREHRADVIIISSPYGASGALQQIISESAEAGAQVFYAAETAPTGNTEIDYVELDGQFVYGSPQIRTRRMHQFLSRGLDIFVSSFMVLCIALPTMLVALAIRLDSEGSIFFHQIRIGLNGSPFTILKFRTMYQEFCTDNISPVDTTDQRITRVGRWLRRTSVDELPQLLNVLRGDMALVGPRPEMPFIVRDYSEAQRQRLSVKPGLTGIWQISAARRYPIHENIHYDLYYLKHRSLAMDVALIFHTLFFALCGI